MVNEGWEDEGLENEGLEDEGLEDKGWKDEGLENEGLNDKGWKEGPKINKVGCNFKAINSISSFIVCLIWQLSMKKVLKSKRSKTSFTLF